MLALLASVAAGIVAMVWLTWPDTYPYGSGGTNRAGFNVRTAVLGETAGQNDVLLRTAFVAQVVA